MNKGKAVVIGAGLGGLSVALRLRKLGYDVDVMERTDQPGGRAAVFERDGFRYDAGPTVLTIPFLFDELFALFDEKRDEHVEFLPVKPWYRMYDAEGRTFDYGGTAEDMYREIARFNPDDVAGYQRLLAHSKELFDEGFTRLGDYPFDRFSSMLTVGPKLFQLNAIQSVWRFVSRYLQNDSLRRFFSIQPLLVGGNPFHTPAVYAMIHYLEMNWGIWYPRGGTGELVRQMVQLGERQGVRYHFNRTVNRIHVVDGRVARVEMADGESCDVSLVVANNDPPMVYRHLIDPEHRRKWTNRRLDRLKYSMGLFVVFFGTDKPYPDLAHHSILFGPRYRELLDDIFEGGILADDPSLYLHRPASTDPAMAPAGKDAFYVLAPVPNLQASIDWDTAGPQYMDLILNELERRVMPDLRRHVVSKFFTSPRYFQDQLQTAHGTGFSIAPIMRQSAWFRFHNKSEDVDGLYFVGAGTHPGAGMPGVVTSAKVIERVLQRDGFRPS